MWQSLLFKPGQEVVLPWYGAPNVYDPVTGRTVAWSGTRGRAYTWAKAKYLAPQKVEYIEAVEEIPEWPDHTEVYVCGDRVIKPTMRLQTIRQLLALPYQRVMLLPTFSEPIVRVRVHVVDSSLALYVGPGRLDVVDYEVVDRYNGSETLQSLADIKGVTPQLEMAYLFAKSMQLEQVRLSEEARIAAEKLEIQRQAEERLAQIRGSVMFSEGRRAFAAVDAQAAVRATLAQVNATTVSVVTPTPNTITVRWYLNESPSQHYNCAISRDTFRVTDAGICLAGHQGELTLEALPSVVREAIEEDLLVITWR